MERSGIKMKQEEEEEEEEEDEEDEEEDEEEEEEIHSPLLQNYEENQNNNNKHETKKNKGKRRRKIRRKKITSRDGQAGGDVREASEASRKKKKQEGIGAYYRAASALFVGLFCMHVGFGLVSPTLALFSASLGASPFGVGLVMSALNLGSTLASVPSAVAVKKFGLVTPQVVGLIVQALVSVCAGLSRNWIVLMMCQVGLGAAHIVTTIAQQIWVKKHIPASSRGRVMGALGGSMRIARLISPYPGGILAAKTSQRMPFFVEAVFDIVPMPFLARMSMANVSFMPTTPSFASLSDAAATATADESNGGDNTNGGVATTSKYVQMQENANRDVSRSPAPAYGMEPSSSPSSSSFTHIQTRTPSVSTPKSAGNNDAGFDAHLSENGYDDNDDGLIDIQILSFWERLRVLFNAPSPARLYEVFTACVFAFILMILRNAVPIVVPLRGEQIGLREEGIGVALTVGSIFDFVCFPLAGIWGDRYGRKFPCAVSVTLMTLGFAVMNLRASMVPYLSETGVLLVGNAFAGMGNGVSSGVVMSMGADMAPADLEGASNFIARWRCLAQAGAFVAPALVGLITQTVNLGVAIVVITVR